MNTTQRHGARETPKKICAEPLENDKTAERTRLKFTRLGLVAPIFWLSRAGTLSLRDASDRSTLCVTSSWPSMTQRTGTKRAIVVVTAWQVVAFGMCRASMGSRALVAEGFLSLHAGMSL